MGKRNKIRYKSAPLRRVEIALTGRIYLQYRDEEAQGQAQKGDLLAYPCYETSGTRQGDYAATGYAGYFKLDVYDGKDWRPVILAGIFPDGEHRFGKRERPIDVFMRCGTILEAMKDKTLLRTYREHYAPEEEAAGPD